MFRHTFRNAIVGHMETRHAGDGGFWRCSVVSPYTANYDEAKRPHSRPTADAARDVSFFFQGGANNRGTYGYAFRQAVLTQTQDLAGAHVTAFSLPGTPTPCRGAITTNCRAGRSNPAFRDLMSRARFNVRRSPLTPPAVTTPDVLSTRPRVRARGSCSHPRRR